MLRTLSGLLWGVFQLALVATLICGALAPAKNIDVTAWSPEIAPAMARAKAENKLVFVQIDPPLLVESKQLDASISDPAVQKLLTRFVCVRLDPYLTGLDAIDGDLGVGAGTPMVCVLDPKGGVPARWGNITSAGVRGALIDCLKKYGLFEEPYVARWNVSTSEFRAYCFDVTPDDIAKSPVWPAGKKFPPLPPRQAIRLAEGALGRISPTAWVFESIRLTPADKEGHWIYRVIFSRTAPPGATEWRDQGFDTVPVLMNGCVPEPVMDHVWKQGMPPESGQLSFVYAPSKDYDVTRTLDLFRWKTYRLTLTNDEVSKSPTWQATQDNPPLSPRNAISAAEARLISITPTYAWKFAHVDLQPSGQADHWIYLVTFIPNLPPDAAGWGSAQNDIVPVLLNGFVPDAQLIYDSDDKNKGHGN